MSELAITNRPLPTIQELYLTPEEALKNDELLTLLNQPVPERWLKKHPYISNYKYLPIDKVEFLLKKIFKKYRIEILREGTSFNGVYVVVRVWYQHPVTGEMEYHDGIGAAALQVKSGSSPADLANINNGALSMAFPVAKTVAIKDACDHFGTLFGADANRKDVLSWQQDTKLADTVKTKEEERLQRLIEKAKDRETLEGLKAHLTEKLQTQFDTKWNELK